MFDASKLNAAIETLPPVTRAVFVLHRTIHLSYGEVAERLMIGIPAVEACIAEALCMLGAIMDGEKAVRFALHGRETHIARAERELRQRYRTHCEDRLRALGFKCTIEWDAIEDDRTAVSKAVLLSLPPIVLETFLLHRVEGLSCSQIAQRKRTFQWIVRRRMIRAIHRLTQGPKPFDKWLLGER
jgi:DNA-directed RNA polymerase specialized sigma24 family protein